MLVFLGTVMQFVFIHMYVCRWCTCVDVGMYVFMWSHLLYLDKTNISFIVYISCSIKQHVESFFWIYIYRHIHVYIFIIIKHFSQVNMSIIVQNQTKKSLFFLPVIFLPSVLSSSFPLPPLAQIILQRKCGFVWSLEDHGNTIPLPLI